MSEIVSMSRKMKELCETITKHAAPGERLVFEMMMNTVYLEGYMDGYAKGAFESLDSPPTDHAKGAQ